MCGWPGGAPLGCGSPAPAPSAHFPPRLWAESLTRSPLCFCATEDGLGLERALAELTSETNVPVVFVKRRKLGGYDPTLKVGGSHGCVFRPPELGMSPPWSQTNFQSQGGSERASRRSPSLENDRETHGLDHVLVQVDETLRKSLNWGMVYVTIFIF